MAVYVIALAGDEPLARLLADPEGAGLPGEVESAAEVNDFWLHVMWPDRAFWLLVEGDGDPQEVAEFLAQRLAGGGWRWRIARRDEAEAVPDTLEAGEQDAWVIETAVPEGAVPPEGRKCRLCQTASVPPHGPGCRAAKTDPGRALPRPLTPPLHDRGSGGLEVPESTSKAPATAGS